MLRYKLAFHILLPACLKNRKANNWSKDPKRHIHEGSLTEVYTHTATVYIFLQRSDISPERFSFQVPDYSPTGKMLIEDYLIISERMSAHILEEKRLK